MPFDYRPARVLTAEGTAAGPVSSASAVCIKVCYTENAREVWYHQGRQENNTTKNTYNQR